MNRWKIGTFETVGAYMSSLMLLFCMRDISFSYFAIFLLPYCTLFIYFDFLLYEDCGSSHSRRIDFQDEKCSEIWVIQNRDISYCFLQSSERVLHLVRLLERYLDGYGHMKGQGSVGTNTYLTDDNIRETQENF